MTEQDISRYQDILITTATDVGLKLLAAIAFWVIGRWLIGMALRMVRSALENRKSIRPCCATSARSSALR